MPMVFQSPTSPDQILFALKDLVDADMTGLRISVAYATRPGCEKPSQCFGGKIRKRGVAGSVQAIDNLV